MTQSESRDALLSLCHEPEPASHGHMRGMADVFSDLKAKAVLLGHLGSMKDVFDLMLSIVNRLAHSNAALAASFFSRFATADELRSVADDLRAVADAMSGPTA
jgi:hypothetical protein